MCNPETRTDLVSNGTSAPVLLRPRLQVWLLAVLLALVTFALYWPAMRCDFINYDDNVYITENPHVQEGLNWENVKWALSNPVAGNWHPLTVLTHMLACQFFGLHPWGHHLINMLLHALNTVLVFLLFGQMTGALWRSVLAAAVFGLHPLHVESVAWVAERKDMLSTCLGLLALLAYTRYALYVEKSQVPSSKSKVLYWLALIFFALGLMSKAMLVTWPFVMLLLDYWPLERFKHSNIRRLVTEKIPFFAVAAVMSVVTFVVQKRGGAVVQFGNLPFDARSGNVLISYCRYLGKLFWPKDLAVFYPHPKYWPAEQVVLAGGFILVITVLFIMEWRRYPFLLMGWLWFIGTLAPVIGLVQVGNQAMADRYTYIPSLGVLILAIWSAYELTRRWRYQVIVLSVVGCAAIVLCLGLTRQQLGYWPDSETLFRHALEVTENNYLAHKGLGDALFKKGQIDEAISQFQEAIRLTSDFADAQYDLGDAYLKNGQIDMAISQFQEAIRLKPNYVQAYNNLGTAFLKKGQFNDAINQYREVCRLNPQYTDAHYNLGTALLNKDRIDEAISQFQETIRLKADYADAHYNLGIALYRKGQTDEAISQYREAIAIEPDYAMAHYNLADIFFAQGRWDGAIEHYQQALKQMPDSVHAHYQLGLALQRRDRFAEAVAQLQKVLELDSRHVTTQNNLAWLLATCPDGSLRDGPKAVALAQQAVQLSGGNAPEILDTLAAAYAEAGSFSKAVATAQRALDLSAAQNKKTLIETIQNQLKLFETNAPFHESP